MNEKLVCASLGLVLAALAASCTGSVTEESTETDPGGVGGAGGAGGSGNASSASGSGGATQPSSKDPICPSGAPDPSALGVCNELNSYQACRIGPTSCCFCAV